MPFDVSGRSFEMWKKCWKTVVFKENYLSVHMKHNSRLTFCLYFAISCTFHFSQESKKKIKTFNGNVKMTYLTFFISFFDGIFFGNLKFGAKIIQSNSNFSPNLTICSLTLLWLIFSHFLNWFLASLVFNFLREKISCYKPCNV